MYVVVEGEKHLFKGIFNTSELARLWAEQQPSSHLEVLEVIPNYPDKTKPMFGPFAGNGHRDNEVGQENPEEETPETAPETVETAPETPETAPETPETAPETPPETKPKKTRNRITKERVQECCDNILGMMKAGEPYKRKYFLEEASITAPEWTKVIRVLLDNGQLTQEGVKKGAQYFLAEETSEGTTEETSEEG